MNLHLNSQEFNDLIELTSKAIRIPSNAVRKDYFITMILEHLAKSDYVHFIVFKGGTSLSKCYPYSIERFSEDIDLTYMPESNMSDHQINKKLKSIEKTLIGEGLSEKLEIERNNRNKSCYVWFSDEYRDVERVKLEIGSSVRPHPYSKKVLKSYIHEYMESIEAFTAIEEFQLNPVEVNVLDIERTFVDKLLAVKRHAICGTLSEKVRHIYDVVQLFKMPEIQKFLQNYEQLKAIIRITKETDSFYLEKRNIPIDYNPLDKYDFETWKDRFNMTIKSNYEALHLNLLFTDNKQNLDEAIEVFKKINVVLNGINE